MDLTESTAPRSDQQNFDDVATTPRTVTITEVVAGTSEQPVEIGLAEYPGRPYKPSKSMRRVLVAAWGSEASTYTGRRMTLVGDPSVKFGGATVGGIKIAALSHIDKPLSLALTVTRGKRATHTVNPLLDAAAPTSTEPTAEQVTSCDDTDVLREMWRASGPERRTQIEARIAELTTTAEPVADAEPANLWDDEPTS